MRIIPLLYALFVTTGCVTTMPGSVSVDKSDYDGTMSVKAEPGWVESTNSTLQIGARRSSTMGDGKAYLIVRNTHHIENFSFEKPNFKLKIEGEEVGLSPLGPTHCETQTQYSPAYCVQEYEVDLALIRRLVESNDVKFRLNLHTSYIEGNLGSEGFSKAKSGLKEFLEKVGVTNTAKQASN